MRSPQVTVTVTQPEVPPPPRTFTLTMDEKTAEVVKAVVGTVTGRGPVRDSIDAVYRALGEHIPYVWGDYEKIVQGMLTINPEYK